MPPVHTRGQRSTQPVRCQQAELSVPVSTLFTVLSAFAGTLFYIGIQTSSLAVKAARVEKTQEAQMAAMKEQAAELKAAIKEVAAEQRGLSAKLQALLVAAALVATAVITYNIAAS